MSGGDRGDGRPTGDRCIVWHPRGAAPDGKLLGALARKGLQVALADNPSEAFAHLCVLGSRHSVGVSGAPPATVLLLVDPEQLAEVSEVVGQADRYAPNAVFWTFDSSDGGSLRAVSPDEVATWGTGAEPSASAPPVVTIAKNIASRSQPMPAARAWAAGEPGQNPAAALAAAIGGPRLRLAGEGKLPPAPDEPGAPDEIIRPKPAPGDETSENTTPGADRGPAPPPPLLTEQELAMLLAKDPSPGQD